MPFTNAVLVWRFMAESNAQPLPLPWPVRVQSGMVKLCRHTASSPQVVVASGPASMEHRSIGLSLHRRHCERLRPAERLRHRRSKRKWTQVRFSESAVAPRPSGGYHVRAQQFHCRLCRYRQCLRPQDSSEPLSERPQADVDAAGRRLRPQRTSRTRNPPRRRPGSSRRRRSGLCMFVNAVSRSLAIDANSRSVHLRRWSVRDRRIEVSPMAAGV